MAVAKRLGVLKEGIPNVKLFKGGQATPIMKADVRLGGVLLLPLLVPSMRIDTVVQPEKAPKVIKAIRSHLTGLKKGDGGLFLKAGKAEL